MLELILMMEIDQVLINPPRKKGMCSTVQTLKEEGHQQPIAGNGLDVYCSFIVYFCPN